MEWTGVYFSQTRVRIHMSICGGDAEGVKLFMHRHGSSLGQRMTMSVRSGRRQHWESARSRLFRDGWVGASPVTLMSVAELPGKWESTQLGCLTFCVSLVGTEMDRSTLQSRRRRGRGRQQSPTPRQCDSSERQVRKFGEPALPGAILLLSGALVPTRALTSQDELAMGPVGWKA